MNTIDAHTSGAVLTWVSIACLSFTGVFAAYVAVAHRMNFMQGVGGMLIAIWSVSRVADKMDSHVTAPEHLLMHLGLALYVLGTVWKLTKERKRP